MKKNFLRMRTLLALVLAVALLAGLAGCGKVDPKEEVKKASLATFAQLAKVGGQFGYDEISKLSVSGNCHQDMELYLKEANVGADISPFYGTGFVMSADSSIKDRKMAIDMGLRLADYNALTMNMYYQDTGIYLGCKELLGDELLGFDTATLAQDMPEAGLDESMNLNVFDLVEDYVDENGKFKLAEETTKALLDAWNAMSDASEWAEGGKPTLTVGEDSGECALYTMTIPAEKFCDFVKSAAKALMNDDYIATIMQSVLMEELYGYESYEAYVDENLDAMDAGLREELTESLTMEFFVNDKLLRGVSIDIQGVELSLFFGMGKNVADHIELIGNVLDEGGFKLVSKGNHVLSDGKFTDNTEFTVSSVSEGELAKLTMDTQYDTKGGAYSVALYGEAEGEAVTMDMNGSLKIDGKTMDMSFDAITVDLMGMNVTLAGSYKISEGEGAQFDVSGARMFTELTDADFENLGLTVQNNAFALLQNIMQEAPEIASLFM
ncbi:MAG: hypothetical protein ACOX81_02505 [Candidatus Heteroscillospira sp.]|jgi:hypothetical protein